MSLSRHLVVAPALALAVMATLAGCDTSEPVPPAPSAPPAADVRPPALASRWQAPVPAGADVDGRLRSWIVGDRVVVVGSRRIAAYDLRSGKRAWTAGMPRGARRVCTAADAPRDRVGAFVLQGGSGCSVVAALDLGRGRWRWHRTIASVEGDDPDVTVTPRVVAAVGRCQEVHRFGVREGQVLPSAAPADDACADQAALLGGTIAVKLDAGAEYGKVGKGLISPQDGVARIAVLSVDDLRRRWQVKVDRQGAAVGGVVTERPLVLDTSIAGHRLLQGYDASGKALRTIGWALSPRHGFVVLGRAPGIVLGDYGPADPGRYAFDTATGDQLWTEQDDATTRTVGLRGPVVVRARQVGSETWVAAHPVVRGKAVSDPARNARAVLLGRIRAERLPALSWSGSTLLAASGGTLSAYPFPAKGREVPALPVSRNVPWADDDVQPAAVPGACRRVRATTLARMGMVSARLPAPADCVWTERFEPTYVERELTTAVRVATPTASTAASEVAAGVAVDQRDALRADGLVLRPVSGLGDKAWFASRPTSDGTRQSTGLVVLSRNVVVTVTAREQALLEERYRDLAVPDGTDLATLGAATDVLAGLGDRTAKRSRGKDGPVTRTPDLCRLLARDGRGLVRRSTAVVTTPVKAAGRMSGCYWSRLDDVYPYLTVSAYAVPGSAVTGASGAATAATIFAGDQRDTPVRGVGDEADVWGFRQQHGRVGSQVLTVRKGNLLVTVRYGAARPDAVLRSAATAVARRILDAS